MRQDAEVGIIGLGAFGASVAWRLASRKVSVLGFEQYQLGHSFGSSHGQTRLFRSISVEHEDAIPLAERSIALFRQLEVESSADLLSLTGGIMLGDPKGEFVDHIRSTATDHNLEYSEFTADEVRRRFPQHGSLREDWVGLFDPNAGILYPEGIIRACVKAAQANDAEVIDRTAVRQITVEKGGVVIETGARTFYVDQVVVCAGAWMSEFLPDFEIEVHRVPMLWFDPKGAVEYDAFDIEKFPVFQRETATGQRIWGHGQHLGSRVKIGPTGDATRDRRAEASTLDRSVTPADWELVSKLVKSELPGLNPQPSKVVPCMTSHTPDGQYLVGRVGQSRVVVAGAGNAHGFKHCSGIGDLIADIITGSEPGHPTGFIDPNRFYV